MVVFTIIEGGGGDTVVVVMNTTESTVTEARMGGDSHWSWGGINGSR